MANKEFEQKPAKAAKACVANTPHMQGLLFRNSKDGHSRRRRNYRFSFAGFAGFCSNYLLGFTGNCAAPFVFLLAFFLGHSTAFSATNEVAPTAAVAKLPTVDKLMENLFARLPTKPITINGDLITNPAKGDKTRLTIAIQLRYPREATYTIGDAFGKPLEQLTVIRENGTTSYRYLAGDPIASAPAPSMDRLIQNTTLSWMDLTLEFLWWNGGQIIGKEDNRGQPCYVLDRHASAGAMAPYASVRIWIDTRVSMLLQADGYDKLANPIRSLSVKSFKKINNEWMIKDLEVEDLNTHATTILRVRDAVAAATQPTP